jgi:hypothetical protein
MGHALEAILDGRKGAALSIITVLTDGEAEELGRALDEMFPMVAGRRAVQYADHIRESRS